MVGRLRALKPRGTKPATRSDDLTVVLELPALAFRVSVARSLVHFTTASIAPALVALDKVARPLMTVVGVVDAVMPVAFSLDAPMLRPERVTWLLVPRDQVLVAVAS